MAVCILYVLISAVLCCGAWHGTASQARWHHAILSQPPQAQHTPLGRLTKDRGGSNPPFQTGFLKNDTILVNFWRNVMTETDFTKWLTELEERRCPHRRALLGAHMIVYLQSASYLQKCCHATGPAEKG